MKFPVDLLADVSQTELEQSAHKYMNDLLYSNPDSPEHFTLSDSTQVTIDISSVGFIPLYGSSDKQRILALFSPTDSLTAVALYLLNQWWAVDHILRTADPARDGAVAVETVGERIVLYILNRVIYRAKEMSSEEIPFLCHGEKDYAKILWNNGEAIGFYSVKPPGSLCSPFSTRCYQLPVMDSIFVRKCQRGKGFGLQMLEDFVLNFKDDYLGLRYPLSKSMYKVCEKYLCQYPEDTELLWEVESIGAPNQRTNISSKIQAMDLSVVSQSLSFTEESVVITEVSEKVVEMQSITTEMKEDVEYTVKIVEEVAVLRTTTEAELPVTARGRSSGSKRRNMGEKITEGKSEKVIRIEDIEAETPQEERVSAQQPEMHDVLELVQTEDVFSVAPEENAGGVDTPPDAEADRPTTVLDSQDNFDVSSSSITEEPQAEDNAKENVNSTSYDSQIIVENVASEDTAVLVASEEVLDVYKETETPNEVGEGRVLRKRTIVSTPTTKRKCTQHNQKVPDGLEKELAEVVEDNEVGSGEVVVVQELAVTGVGEPEELAPVKEDAVAMEELNDEGQQVQEEQPTKETVMAKKVETGVEETVLKDCSELPDSVETALPEEDLSDDEMVEPPVVQRRGLRGRCKVTPQLESTNQSKTHGHEVEHTDEEHLGAGGSAGEEQADEKAMEKQVEENLTPPTEMSVEECKELQEEPETASATEMQEEEAEDVIQEPLPATATSGIELSDKELEDTALTGTKEMQESDSCCEISNLHQATVILVDLKATGLHLSVRMAEATSAEAEYSAPEREEVGLVAPEDKEASSNSASGQTPEPGMLLLDDTEKSADTATEEETSEKGALKEDSLNEENKESVTLDVRTQELDEGNVDEFDKKKVAEGQADAGEVDAEMEAIETDVVTIADLVEDCLSEQEAGNSQEEVCAVTTRTLRKGRNSASASTKSKRKTMCKEIQEEENKEACDSESVEVTREKKEAVMGGAVEKSSEEREERMEEGAASDSQDNLEQKTNVKEEETVAEEGQGSVAEEQSEAISETSAEKGASGEEYDERNAATVGEETEPSVGSVTRSLRSGGKTPRAPLKHRSRRSTKQPGEEKWEGGTSTEKSAEDHKPSAEPRILRTASLKSQEDDGTPPETAEKAIAEDDKQDEAEQLSATAQEAHEIQVEMEEPVAVEVEKEALEKGPTDEDGNAAGVTAAADDVVQEVEACTSPKPTNNSALGTPPEEEAATSSEKQQSEEMVPPLSHLQKVTVVLVVADTTKVEPKTAPEDVDTGAKEAVTVLDTVPDETEAPAEYSVDEEKTSDIADEAITTQGSEEGEQHTTKSDVAPEEGDEAKGFSDVDEAPVKETRVLRSGEKADEQEDEATREKSTEAEASVDRRVLRKGRRSAAATPRCKSKRARTQLYTEEEGEDKTTSVEETQTEELTGLEDSKGREENRDETTEGKNEDRTGVQTGEKSGDYEQEIGEDPVGQQEHTTGAAVELKTVQTVAEQQTVEEEQSAVLETCANEWRETPVGEINTEEATDEDQPPVVERRVLRSRGEVVNITSSSQNAQSQQDENKQEGTADKVSSDTDEPTAETKVLRKGKRSAAAIPRHKANRGRTQCETEEEGEEEPTPVEQIQAEETNINEKECSNEEIIEERDGDGSVAQEEEKTKMGKEDVTVAEESMTEQEEEPVEEQPADESGQEGTAAEKSSDTDEQAKGRRVLRKKRRSSPAIPRHKAKRACKRWQVEQEEKERTEGEEEEPGLVKEDKDVKKEGHGEAEGESAVGHSEEMKDESTEGAAVPEKEDDSKPAVLETRTKEMDKATTVPEDAGEGFHSAVAEEEPPASVSAEEEAPTSRLLRSKRKSSQATPSRGSCKRNNQGLEEIQQQEVEDDPEDEKTQEDLPDELRAEEQAGTDEASLVGLEAEEIATLIDDNESACEDLQELSSVKGIVEGDVGAAESTSEQQNTLSLGLSTDDVELETTGLNQKDEEDEQEEVEPIVIGKKVLRGRTVPSVTITPSKSRHHHTKVHEHLSAERSPRSLGKRKGAEVTPAGKFKRHSRV